MSRIAWCLVLAGLVCGSLAAPVPAKSYYFPRVAIDARVSPDGSLWVTEHRTYQFGGDFSWATYTLERHGWTDVTDIGVADEQGRFVAAEGGAPRTYQVTMSPQGMDVKWHFRAADEEKTFTIRYRVAGAVTRYRDTAELYWRFIGTGWDVQTAAATVRVQVPKAARVDLRAWGHGPLSGTVEVVDEGAALAVSDLDPETFVEARILFPALLVPGARFVDETALPRILNEEARFARAANLERLAPLLNVLAFPFALGVALLVWFVLYLRHGK
jgi:hypothetical protein